MTDDTELLRCYAEEKSDEAFGELVRRHLDFVYAAALRQARGNASLAQDVAQVVFTDLARKAGTLARHEVIVGWLHTATRFAAAKAIRTESRRSAREQEAFAMNEALGEPEAPVDWARLHPVIDEVLGELKERERAAVLLRFFEKKPLAEVGEKLSLTESAARSCVDRALEKMHGLLAQRGMTSTAAALSVALANQAGVAAPSGLAASITGAVLTQTVATLTIGTKLGLVLAAMILMLGSLSFEQHRRTNAMLRGEVIALTARATELVRLRGENGRLARENAEVAILRDDDAELTRLEREVVELRQRQPEARPALVAAGAVTISGMIKAPGNLKMPAAGQTLTLREVIDRANGLTDTANQAKIRVTRIMADGTTKIFTLDYVTDGARFTVEPDDIVYVPERIL